MMLCINHCFTYLLTRDYRVDTVYIVVIIRRQRLSSEQQCQSTAVNNAHQLQTVYLHDDTKITDVPQWRHIAELLGAATVVRSRVARLPLGTTVAAHSRAARCRHCGT